MWLWSCRAWKKYHGGVRYVEQAEDDFPNYKIDEHWELMMMPNI